MAQVEALLPKRHEALTSNPSTAKRKNAILSKNIIMCHITTMQSMRRTYNSHLTTT
jgi:hypothetical protein